MNKRQVQAIASHSSDNAQTYNYIISSKRERVHASNSIYSLVRLAKRNRIKANEGVNERLRRSCRFIMYISLVDFEFG